MKYLKNPESGVIGAFKRLSQSPDGELIKRYLRAELLLSDESNRYQEGPALHRSQGKSITLSDILEVLESK